MKTKIIPLLALCILPLFADSSLDFSDPGLSFKKYRNSMLVVNGKSWKARVWNWYPHDKNYDPMEQVKLTMQDGVLTIDASKCEKNAKGNYGIFAFEIFPPKTDDANKLYAHKEMVAEIEVKSDRLLEAKLIPFYQEKRSNGKTVTQYRRYSCNILSEWKKITTRYTMMENILSEPTFRLTFEQPAVVQIRSGSLRFEDRKEVKMPVGNQILNGGAELGEYAVSNPDFSNLPGHVYMDHVGKAWTNELKATVDDKVFASGKHSFRLDGGGKVYQNWFRLNPVRYIPGKRVVITFKAKAKEPGTRLMTFCARSTSAGYKFFKGIPMEWTNIRFDIPAFGTQKAYGSSGVYPWIGRPADEVAFYPTFWANKTVWLDDICIWQGDGEYTFQNPSPAFSVQLEKAYDRIGKTIPAELAIRNDDGKKKQYEVTLSLTDFYGKQLEEQKIASVSLDNGEKKKLKIEIPIRKLGPQTATFTVKSGDQILSQAYHYGGISNTDGPVRRICYDTAPVTPEYAVRFFRDMRVGSARCWVSMRNSSMDRNFSFVKALHDSGVYVIANIDLDGKGGAYQTFSRHDLSSWPNVLRKYLEPLKDAIDCYEILNEPNIWNGFRKNPDPSVYRDMTPKEYVRILKIAHDTIRSFAPKARFAGPTPCGIDLNFIEQVLAEGGSKLLDEVNYHPYQQSPEIPDYYEKMKILRSVVAKYGNLPTIATESGWQTDEMFVGNKPTPYVYKSLGLTIRHALTTFASGSSIYTAFHLSAWPYACMWSLIMSGSIGKINEMTPQPICYALRATADLLGDDSKSLGPIYLGYDNRCYLFDNGKTRTSVLWRWNGKPQTVKIDPAWKGNFYDVMGNRLSGSFEFGILPVYFQTTEPVSEIKKICRSFAAGLSMYTADFIAVSPDKVKLTVVNQGMKEIKGFVAVDIGGETMNLEIPVVGINEKKEFLLTLKQPLVANQARKAEITLNMDGDKKAIKKELRELFVPYLPLVKIDGKEDEWEQIPELFTLTYKDHYNLMPQGQTWSDEAQKITANAKAAWNENGIYFRIKVNKKDYIENGASTTRLWAGDSIQIAFDPLRNAKPGQARYDDDDFEYTFGLYQGKEAVFRHRASHSIFDSLNKDLGLLKGEVPMKIIPGKDATIYEIHLPPRSISPFQLKKGAAMTLSMIVNISTGKRIGYLRLTPGIGEGKKPSEFLDFILQ